MAKYRKKPVVVVEAVQFEAQNRYKAWPICVRAWSDEKGAQPRDMSWGYIDTLEGRKHVMNGDWIVTDDSGRSYPYSPAIFEQTYELAEEE